MGQAIRTGGERTKIGSRKQSITNQKRTVKITQEVTHMNPEPWQMTVQRKHNQTPRGGLQ